MRMLGGFAHHSSIIRGATEMMHGKQKLTLTKASVQEALQDYLQKHLGATVYGVVQDWNITPNTYGADIGSIDVTFTQAEDKPGPSPPTSDGDR